MSGFDKEWLALREPVDARSRDETLLTSAIAAIEAAGKDTVLDIGCGTGSTLRALSPRLLREVKWRLLDHDQHLLDEAKLRHTSVVEIVRGDLNQLEALPIANVGLVTASALFDLSSETFIRDFVERISSEGLGLYAPLNYDGGMQWSSPHPLDAAVVACFNAHQLSDKGFGLSLGPAAWETLGATLKKKGYMVQVAESPWIMAHADAGLQRRFLDGVLRAVMEYGQLDDDEIKDWANFRYRMVSRTGELCRVGHKDILALR